jgi:diguanylate cyclase (GGDEF)-like protein
MHNSIKIDSELIGFKMVIPSILAILFITVLAGYSYYWNIENIRTEKLNLALAEAKANWNKDAAFRSWATLHGGLYVEPNKRTPPNPYLAHIPKRDVVTTDGMKLTLMNPAYMMSQMTQEFEESYGVKGKITGKIQLNPNNKPDQWELKVLNQFEKGEIKSTHEQAEIDGEPYLRYMKSMYMTDGCVKCHGHLGFKDGDLRGGVSISIPLKPYFAAAQETRVGIIKTHLIIWVFGLISIAIFSLFVRKLLTRMAHTAVHDDMTKLPNTVLFKNRVNQSLKKVKRDPDFKFAVCFMDLDRFKNLNDCYGHSIGDSLLIELSNRLSILLRPSDTIARMSGDEFLILLDNINDLQEVLMIINRILSSFKEPFLIQNHEIFSNASIGICMSSPNYSVVNDMIRDADIAMYRAKGAGKGRLDVFNPEMHDFAIETMMIENELRSALDKNQLDIHYQPVVNIDENRIEGFEALLRWNHPVIGNVSPDRFIPVAEHTGQIKLIGKWVLENACKMVHKWNLQYGTEKSFSMAVNLSAAQLIDDDVKIIIQKMFDETIINKDQLHLEVTETMLIGQKKEAQDTISSIRNMGVRVSIDDFGKGYSSLIYLQDFEFDTLKIDKDFVQDMSGKGKGLQLVRTLLLLARDLKMNVIAEGVETADQLGRLKAMGCQSIQGYYYSKPLDAAGIEQLFQTGCHLDANKLLNENKNFISSNKI